jgi:hypothetical protein
MVADQRPRHGRCEVRGSRAGTGLPDDVDMGKAIFVFDAEQPIIISKIHSANVYDLISVHRSIVFAIDTIARDGILPRSDFLIWRALAGSGREVVNCFRC